MVTNGGPFRATDDADVFDGQNGKEQVLVCAIVPILVVHGHVRRLWVTTATRVSRGGGGLWWFGGLVVCM